MKAKYYLYTFFLILSCNKDKKKLQSELSSQDSVSYYLKSIDLIDINEEQKLNQLNKAFNLILSDKNSSNNRESLSKIAFEYYNLNELNKFKETSVLLYKNSKISKDTVNIAKSFRFIGGYYKNTKVYDSSFYYYLKAEKIYKNLNDDQNYSNVLLSKGILQWKINDFIGADLTLRNAYNYYVNSDEKQKLYSTLNQLGLVSIELKEYKKAERYHSQALEVVKKFKLQDSEHQEAVCYNNLGYLYIKQNFFNKAKQNFELALNDKAIINDDPDLYCYLIDNLGYSRMKLNNNKELPNLFYEALKIRDSLKSTPEIISSYNHLSEYYSKKKDTIQSLEFVNKSMKIANQSNSPFDKILALKQAALVDKKNSSKYSERYIQLTDSLQIVERKNKDLFARIQLETNEITQQKDELESDNRNYLYYLLGMFIVSLTVFIVRTQITKNRILTLEKAQQQANEDILKLIISQQNQLQDGRVLEKQRISKELHDGVLGRMFGLRLNLDGLNKYDDEGSKQLRLEYINELKVIEQDIREISHELSRENTVIINNFVAILNNLFVSQRSVNPAKLEIKINETIDWDHASSVVKINFYRIVQESLQNINKYAKAKKIKLDITIDEGNIITFTLVDDGIGFDTEATKDGIGVKNMLARVKECNGSIDIKSEINKGTTTIVILPLDGKKQKSK